MITSYLLALSEQLQGRLSPVRRRRVLAEVEDHLLSAAAELRAAGLPAHAAEREAAVRFGDSAELARIFTAEQAARSAGGLGHLTLVVSAVVAYALAPARGLPAGAVFTAVLGFMLIQVALVTGALTWWRSRAARRTGSLAGDGLGLIRRGSVVVAGTAVLGAIDIGLRATSGGRSGTALACAGICAGGAAACAAVAERCRRLSVAAPPFRDPVLGLSSRLGAWLRPRAPRLSRWVDLARRPWRVAVLVAVAAGGAFALGHGVAEGTPTSLGLGLLAAGLLASIEAACALIGFAVLGCYLGLRGHLTPTAPCRPGASAPKAPPACGTRAP